MSSRFADAAAAIGDPSVNMRDLAKPLMWLFHVDGASISTLGAVLSSETLSATDSLAQRVDELQFDLGEGPSWDAVKGVAPVLARDLNAVPSQVWPAFTVAATQEGVCALFAFPLAFGPIRLGAIDLYARTPTDVDPDDVDNMAIVSGALSRRILANALQEARNLDDDSEAEAESRFSRRLIHQASGVVLAQLDVQPEDAYLLIQGHAFAERRSMREIAEDILERRIRFGRTATGITVEAVGHE